jgi:hypothetical protein
MADREVRSTAYSSKPPAFRTIATLPASTAPAARSTRRFAPAPPMRVRGRRLQCRPGRRPRHGQDASRHRDRRPGHRASPQARPVLLHLYKPRRGFSDISVLSSFRHRRSLSRQQGRQPRRRPVQLTDCGYGSGTDPLRTPVPMQRPIEAIPMRSGQGGIVEHAPLSNCLCAGHRNARRRPGFRYSALEPGAPLSEACPWLPASQGGAMMPRLIRGCRFRPEPRNRLPERWRHE